MTKYEIMFIVKATQESENVAATADAMKKIITDNKSNVVEFKELGEKKLAYPIKKELTGFYFVVNFNADNETVAELDRKARIDENVLRHMIIRLDEE